MGWKDKLRRGRRVVAYLSDAEWEEFKVREVSCREVVLEWLRKPWGVEESEDDRERRLIEKAKKLKEENAAARLEEKRREAEERAMRPVVIDRMKGWCARCRRIGKASCNVCRGEVS